MLVKHVLAQALGASLSLFFDSFFSFDIFPGETVLCLVCEASVLTWVIEGIRKIWVSAELCYRGQRLCCSHMITKPKVPHKRFMPSKCKRGSGVPLSLEYRLQHILCLRLALCLHQCTNASCLNCVVSALPANFMFPICCEYQLQNLQVMEFISLRT